MAILITGSSGLLGKKVFEKLKYKKYSVFGISKSKQKFKSKDLIYIDLNKDWSLRLLPKNIDTIIHLAQSNNYKNFPIKSADIFNVNVVSTAKLLDFAYKNKVKKFIYASSGGVYVNHKRLFNENDPILISKKLNYYLGSKLSGEMLCQHYAPFFQTTIIRPFFIYGSGQKRSMLIPKLFDMVKKGMPITLQGKSGIKINPIHVDDASDSILACLKLNNGNQTFNIAGPEILSIKAISKKIGYYLNKKPIFNYENTYPKNVIADISKMKKFLIKPKKYFSEMLIELDK